MNASWDILKILSDPTRLRLLALVMRDVIDEHTFATLYAPFAALVWVDAL